MNAAASSLIDAIKASYGGVPTGTDWDYIPSGATSWYKYGGGGVSSWGTLCGVPNGCIAVLNLMGLNSGSWVDQIMYYSCQTLFPINGLHDQWLAEGGVGWAKEPVPDDEVLAYTTADSPLCHVSASKWAYAAGVSMTEPTAYSTAQKTDRCAKVVAAIAAFTANLINDGVTSSFAMPDATAACYSCHNTATVPAQQGKMDCEECHADLRPHREATSIPPTANHDPEWTIGLDAHFIDASSDNNGRPQSSLTITVNWGDGQVSTGKGGAQFDHSYAAPGKYTILHTAKDLGNLYASEFFDVSVPDEEAAEKYSITVNVTDSATSPVGGATVYMKQKKVGDRWKQIMYGYTDASGNKTFANLLAGAEYKAVVYKTQIDFNGAKKGKQSKVKFEDIGKAPYELTGDLTIYVQQGTPATNGPAAKPWKGDDGGVPDIDP